MRNSIWAIVCTLYMDRLSLFWVRIGFKIQISKLQFEPNAMAVFEIQFRSKSFESISSRCDKGYRVVK